MTAKSVQGMGYSREWIVAALHLFLVIFHMILFALLACSTSKTIVISTSSSESDSSEEVQPEPSDPVDIPEVDEEFCDTAPSVTWNNWTNSLFITHCQGCHAQSSPDRYGAPENIHFDDESATIELADRVWIRVIEEETMPPAGGILEDDLYLLEIWLRCSVGL